LVASVLTLATCVGCTNSSKRRSLGVSCSALESNSNRVDFYTKHALRDFQPGGEVVDSNTPRPESLADVAGVFFRPGTLVTRADARLINQMHSAYVLGVEKCNVSEEFWETLSLSRLKYLYAGGSNLDDHECMYLARGDSLVYISLYETRVSKEGKAIIESRVPGVSINDWYY
jgi:hypothetical protein